jgi:hypothetical protein
LPSSIASSQYPRWGEQYHQQGLKQLSDYLDRQCLKEGFLVIFDHSEIKNWQSEWLEVDGKKVFRGHVKNKIPRFTHFSIKGLTLFNISTTARI